MKNVVLQELTIEEMKEIDGGLGLLAAAAITLAVLYVAGTCCALSQGSNPHTGGKM